MILALLILLFPESPRWLIDHGKEEEGLHTIAKLHAHGNRDDAWVQAEYTQIQHAIAEEHEHAARSYMELFKDKSSFRRLLVSRIQLFLKRDRPSRLPLADTSMACSSW